VLKIFVVLAGGATTASLPVSKMKGERRARLWKKATPATRMEVNMVY